MATNPLVKAWLKGANRQRPPSRQILPSWDLGLVLRALGEYPFEPFHSATLELWTKKVVFLLAVTSAARVSELQALDIRPELTKVRDNSAILRLNPAFMCKVPSEANLNREIVLQAFYPDFDTESEDQVFCNSLCPVRALRIYLEKTSRLRLKDHFQLLVQFSQRFLGQPATLQHISKWVVEVINMAYAHYGKDPPDHVTAHSTRAIATSMATLGGASIQDICKAATWSSSHVFVKHYKLDVVPRSAGSISSTDLKTALEDEVNP